MLVTPRPKGKKRILSENATAMADMALITSELEV